MSERNVELARHLIETFNAGDTDGFIAHCAPDIEMHSAFAAVGGGLYEGHDELRKYFVDLEDAWGGKMIVAPEAFYDLGERTLVFYTLHGRSRESGVDVEMPVALLVRWRDDLGVYVEVFAHREDALASVGMSEDALQRIEP